MKLTSIDRAVVIWLASAVLVWSLCLLVLWMFVLGSSGWVLPLSAAAMMFSLWLAGQVGHLVLAVPARFFSMTGSDSQMSAGVATSRFSSRSGPDVRSVLRLLALASFVAFLCGILATAGVFLSGYVIELVSRNIVFTSLSWSFFAFVVMVAGLIPMAISVRIMFLSGLLLRSGMGHDVYATHQRDWFWAVVLALTILGVSLAAGVDLLAMSLLASFGLLLGTGVLLKRKDFHKRPGRLLKPIEKPRFRHKLRLAASFFVLVMALVIQHQLLSTILPIGLVGRICYLAGSLALIVYFQSKADGRGRLPGFRQGIGCIIALACSLVMQVFLVTLAATSVASAVVCLPLVLASQVPLSALAGNLLCRQRLLFVNAGGRAGDYLSVLGVGVSLGLLSTVIIAQVGITQLFLGLLALAMMAGGYVTVIFVSRKKIMPAFWSGSGIVLLISLGVGVFALQRTSLLGSEGLFVRDSFARESTIFCSSNRWQSAAITDFVGKIFQEESSLGRWWMIGQQQDLPSALPYKVRVVSSKLGFLSSDISAQRRFDGIYLSVGMIDHPDAWRYLNRSTLARARSRVVVSRDNTGQIESSRILVRVQSSASQLGRALSAARSFYDVMHSTGYLVVDFRDGMFDILLVSSGGLPHTTKPILNLRNSAKNLHVISLQKLFNRWPEISPITIRRLPGIFDNNSKTSPSSDEFTNWLSR